MNKMKTKNEQIMLQIEKQMIESQLQNHIIPI